MNENIPAGYSLYITSWENDGDIYKTQNNHGLTGKQVSFCIDLAKQFKSKNDRSVDGHKLGNSGHEAEKLIAVFNEVAARHPGYNDHNFIEYEITEESIHDWLCEWLFGYTETYFDEENFCRVVDGIKVVFVPEALQDVTKQFI